MNIEDARRIAELIIKHDTIEAEIKRIDNRLKYVPANEIAICVKCGVNLAHIIDEFEINKDELSGILEYMKNRRKFINQNLEKELDRYVTRYRKSASWDDEDDLK